jgi:cytochrome P450
MPCEFNPLSDAFAADPYPIYAAMRATPRPTYYAGEDTYMLTRYADVQRVALAKTSLRDRSAHQTPEEIAAQRRALNMHDMPFHERYVQANMLDSDGAPHDRQRKLVFRTFTRSFVDRQRPTITALVDRKISEIKEKEEIDFIADFAAAIPGTVIGHVIGVPEADRPLLGRWSEEVVSFYNVGRDAAGKAIAERAAKECAEYLIGLVAERRKAPRDDLLTELLRATEAGTLHEDELISLSMLILMAGHGSTIDVLGSGLHALLRFPDQMARLRADPGLMDTAVQEMFRFEAPLPYFHRFAMQDTEIGGETFPAGTRFGLLYGAANRDPAAFEAPDLFDIARSPNRHIAFGAGPHFCLGNHLARLDMEVIFAALLKTFARIELLETPAYKRGLSVRGPKALRIALTPA